MSSYQSEADEIDREEILNDMRSEAKQLENCHGDHPCDSETCVWCLGKDRALANLRKQEEGGAQEEMTIKTIHYDLEKRTHRTDRPCRYCLGSRVLKFKRCGVVFEEPCNCTTHVQ